jgi:hypothetical protein
VVRLFAEKSDIEHGADKLGGRGRLGNRRSSRENGCARSWRERRFVGTMLLA